MVSVPPARARASIRTWVSLTTAIAATVALLAIAGGAVGIVQLTAAREQLADVLDPANQTAQQLSAALVDQENGIRGALLSGQRDFLTPYEEGRRAEATATAALRQLLDDGDPQASRNLNAVVAASRDWHDRYAEPTLAGIGSGGPASVPTTPEAGKALFDQIRSTLDAQSTHLVEERTEARGRLDRAAATLAWISGVIGALLVLSVIALVVFSRRGIILPIDRLGRDVRTVADGDFAHVVPGTGPAELAQLGLDVDSMRLRIVAELSAVEAAHRQLDERSKDLERSNAELEQFAYVASHDLQEPLRKVASFCQLIEERYHEQLDDRGRQYIDFAVDGATRMQALINDLLSFSRVGRFSGPAELIAGEAVLAQAIRNLAAAIEDTGATIIADPFPALHGDASLLATALQNLIGNAIKFHRADQAPTVRLIVRDDGDDWLFSCVDNGIGIDPDYADRVFVIFQRLHPKSAYPGTGIGLAMCRKIIEYHGGRIWLAATGPDEAGSTFCFTLPKVASATVAHSTLTERPGHD